MMSNSRITSRAEAEFMRIALLTGVVSLDAAISWADQRIRETDEPPYWIIELSLGKNRRWSDLDSILRWDSGDGDPDLGDRVFLAALRHAYADGILTEQAMLAALAKFAQNALLPKTEQGRIAREVDEYWAWDGLSEWRELLESYACFEDLIPMAVPEKPEQQ